MVREHIRVHGPLRYADLVDIALYDPDYGFYASGGRAGRRGDFLTSAEVGPLFGHVVANAIDSEWDRLGQPDQFTFVDFGAGPGTLARAVLAARPRCGEHLRYLAIERSAVQRESHPRGVVSLEALTSEVVGTGLVGVIFANELLDNLAFTPVRWRDDTALLAMVVEGADGELVEEFISVPNMDTSHLVSGRSVVDQTEAGEWVNEMKQVLVEGRLIVVDYARLDTSKVDVRTYSEHGRAGDPLAALGTKDITVDLDIEALERFAGPATARAEQREWLAGHGIEALVEQGRTIWERDAAIGGLDALRAKSRLREADSLCDPNGLGGFHVVEWVI